MPAAVCSCCVNIQRGILPQQPKLLLQRVSPQRGSVCVRAWTLSVLMTTGVLRGTHTVVAVCACVRRGAPYLVC